ncbi:MAG: DUF3179 domain-containing protein [Azospirillaceae bacterium]
MTCLNAAAVLVLASLGSLATALPVLAQPERWWEEFPLTDWSRHDVPFDEIISGGPPRDGIPAIDAPEFTPAADADLGPTEPVMSVIVDDDARAYPLRILIWHEIVNDTVGGLPLVVTYCPLCNSGVVYERRLSDMVLDFGTTGRLRNSDLVMYDRQTESWWQQFSGDAIIGAFTGAVLEPYPARLESVERFVERHPDGRILAEPSGSNRPYGTNPYTAYDSAARPFLYRGTYDGPGAPLSRVVAVGDRAWLLTWVQENTPVTDGDLVLTWQAGQNSALDTALIADGRDVGNVIVQRRMPDGALVDIAYDVPFAFAFRAFYPNGTIVAGPAD